MRILITGVPGTGKSSVAAELSRSLELRIISLNAIAEQFGLYSFHDQKLDSKVVKLNPLEIMANEIIMLEKKGCIIDGHLGADIKLCADLVVVLRTSPLELKNRLEKRKYSKEKIAENVNAEIVDYCTIKAERNYGKEKVWEIDTSGKKAENIAEKILKIAEWLKGKKKFGAGEKSPVAKRKKAKKTSQLKKTRAPAKKSVSWSGVVEQHPELLRL